MRITQIFFRFIPFALLTLLASLTIVWSGEDSRFFQPTPGFTRARDLPDDFQGKIGEIRFNIRDAFDGAETHSDAEKTLYDIGNKLHINTRETTVRRRLLFREGDMITADLLRETEKNLREEQFLADAIIEVIRQSDSTVLVRVTTYDQWTTVPAFSVNRKGGKWVWWVGPVESNLLGTGQRLGFFVGQDIERDSRWIDFENKAFTPLRLQLLAQYAWLSDGYFYSFGLSRPLRARTDEWGFSISATGGESAENLYLSGNDLDALEHKNKLDSTERFRLGQTNLLGQWDNIATHSSYVGITRAYGYSLKFSVTPFYERESRHLKDSLFYVVDTALWDSLGLDRTKAPPLNARHDELLGATMSVYRYSYKTVHNFRNLKWSETLETGWRLSASMAQNQDWLGANNRDWLLSYAAVYNNAWMDALFLNSGATLRNFISPQGTNTGSTSASVEGQWKPIYYLSTVLNAQYDGLFADTTSKRLYLGEESGLIGFPNFYYSGRAKVLVFAEQRFFPPFEFGTVVPAFAVFVNGGNTYRSQSAVDLSDMHYALGVGLRLGATRSVQKVVNHVNVVWPLGEKNLSGWSWGIRASKSL
ncbi:MAG TPA: hypothetical protein DCQ83_03720 [Fibrobacteres bacterium]|nr:hypothetical protein [Fibrobacterota bacterium]